MPLSALLLSLLAPAALSPSAPINVTGHAWAPFISPMGEPFRARTTSDDTLADWFRQADANHDGLLTAGEMQADAERFFRRLDTNPDGEIDPDEIANYEYEIAPEIQVMSRTRRPPGEPATARDVDVYLEKPRDRKRRRDRDYASLGFGGSLQGAARYGLLNIPEPVAAADADFNRGISLEEFRQAALARFQLLDSTHRGSLTLTQLQALRPEPPLDGRRPKHNEPGDDRIGNPLPTGP
ncbi:EF-hand domain-containing protein [Sphingomonas segetis]|jgi:Ca2+-binding EF-hand superfamily protein|uniref:EF-hand domain-containing protein n=1 Tax=Sphingomonas segetis TaxID=1104779 RepID=UPI0012D36771|nr:EF-hand domain-containing protein [Sphingomonas segetis]